MSQETNNQIFSISDKEMQELNSLLESMPSESAEAYNTACKCWYVLRDHSSVLCSISGGYDSDIMLDLIIRCGGASKTKFVFFNTGLEYEATLRHLDYLEDKYGVHIHRTSPKLAIPTCCKRYGAPFWSKYVSDMIYRLQLHGFDWSNGSFEELLGQYPNCRSALKWWCNEWGDNSRFNIEYTPYLKEFMMEYPPEFKISAKCCEKAKKEPAHAVESEAGIDLVCTGVRKKEKGARSTAYKSCFDSIETGTDKYRPLFWWSNVDKDQYREHFGLQRSDCYEIWGMTRTGCAGCPFGKEFQSELELAMRYEPLRYKAMLSIFGESYTYTKKYMEFRAQLKTQQDSMVKNQNGK